MPETRVEGIDTGALWNEFDRELPHSSRGPATMASLTRSLSLVGCEHASRSHSVASARNEHVQVPRSSRYYERALNTPMRVGIISLFHESNSFLRTPTTIEDFRRDMLLFGEDIRKQFEGGLHEISGFFE